eukprot:Clim_evm33s119 gene=Clim_evmTU33s119
MAELAHRKRVIESDSEDDIPLAALKKPKQEPLSESTKISSFSSSNGNGTAPNLGVATSSKVHSQPLSLPTFLNDEEKPASVAPVVASVQPVVPKVEPKAEDSSQDELPLASLTKKEVKTSETDTARLKKEPAMPKTGTVVPKTETPVKPATKPFATTTKPSAGDSSDDDDLPLAALAKKPEVTEPSQAMKNGTIKTEGAMQTVLKGESDSDDEPLAVVAAKSQSQGDAMDEDSDSDSESMPLAMVVQREKDLDEISSKVVMKKKDKAKRKAQVAASVESMSATTAVSTQSNRKLTMEEKRELRRQQEAQEVVQWWDTSNKPKLKAGERWKTLQWNGIVFAPPYEAYPESVKFKYAGERISLSLQAEEVASFFAAMANTDYAGKPVFIKNFMKDWRKFMTKEERAKITNFKDCDFTEMVRHEEKKRELKKAMTKEEKEKIKKQNEELIDKYGYCMVDGTRERIGNFRVEPPGLFRGRGSHPKMGRVKKRVHPESVTVNTGRGVPAPQAPEGHRWKKVLTDRTVTWLATWKENIMGAQKYVMLNAASRFKGESDLKKYEKARKLKKHINKIRRRYRRDWKDKMMYERQRGTCLYFIDILALRVGNEKDTDQEADTVGCTSLRIEHIELHPRETPEGKDHVTFDFLGKDSIQYRNTVEVDEQVFKNLKIFTKNKKPADMLFDRVDGANLNKYLQEQMKGLSAKVFRTYNASHTLQEQLKDTPEKANEHEKILAYNRANRQVAILCNHQRAVPKTHDQSMGRLEQKIKDKRKQKRETKKKLNELLKELKEAGKDTKNAAKVKTLRKRLKTMDEQLKKLQIQKVDKDENKTIALGTSKLNYCDPRITVAWCKRYNVPIEKVYNKTQRQKFMWSFATEPEWEF